MGTAQTLVYTFLGILVAGLAAMADAQPDLDRSFAASPTDFVRIWPGGDGQDLAGITVTLVDANGSPVVNYPRSLIWADAATPGALTYCSLPFLADAPTDAQGQTTISGTTAGGGYTNQMYVYVGGSPLSGSPLNITVVSPDINGDSIVDLRDASRYFVDIEPSYHYRSDFNNDGVVNVSDISILNDQLCHACPNHSYGTIPTSGEVGIFFDTGGTQTSVLGLPFGSIFHFYVVSWNAPGDIGGFELGIDVDSRIVLISATLNPASWEFVNYSVSEVQTSTTGNCLPSLGPTVLVDYLAILLSSDQGIPICLRGTPTACLPDITKPAYTICDDAGEWRYFGTAYTGCALVNGDGPIEVQSTTWGGIKSLYTD